MHVHDKHYYRAWLKTLKLHDPLALWTTFVGNNDLPPLTFSFEAAAVYSSNIEGNRMDLRAFLESKAGRTSRLFRAKERKEIEALVAAYQFARNYALNEKNLLHAHTLLARPLLPKSQQGRYRDQLMFVYSQYGIEYAAVEPAFVPEKMRELFASVKAIHKAAPDVRDVFYHAALLHLVFVHIHPFQDGNGRTARLLEKWLLAKYLGKTAWQIPSEQYYKEHPSDYYRSIKIGLNYDTLNYDQCVPFLTLLVKSLVR